MSNLIEKGKIIGEFDLQEYNLPTSKAYLVHQVTKEGRMSETREYLRIIGMHNKNIIPYGYVYFILQEEEKIPISKYIGSAVSDEYRGKGLGDLLMSIYLYYSYDQGFSVIESTTRQRKLDILSLMNKYDFRVKYPHLYYNGDRVTLYKNKMVIDIYKNKKGETYYKFKTRKAEELYKKNHSIIADNYRYLSTQISDEEMLEYVKLGWIVPNEAYKRRSLDDSLITKQLEKSKFSR